MGLAPLMVTIKLFGFPALASRTRLTYLTFVREGAMEAALDMGAWIVVGVTTLFALMGME
jgi:hypothetical protein